MKIAGQDVFPFLMFSGQAEAAIKFYTSVFDKAEVIHISKYGANEAGKEGTVFQAAFSIKGQVIMCIDSSVEQPFSFTPAISIYVQCHSEEEITRIYNALSDDGIVLMPLDKYPFSDKYAWVEDKFGVCWQLSFENNH